MFRLIRICGIFFVLIGTLCANVPGEERITLYTSVPTRIMGEIENEFERRTSGVDLTVFRSGTGRITAKIAAERQAGEVKADVIWLADFAYYETLKEEGLLLPYKTEAAEGIPKALQDADGCYYAARMVNSVIAYNTRFVKRPPSRWEHLLDRSWRGQVVMPNPLYSGASLDTVGAITMNYGLSYYRRLRENRAVVVRGNTGAAGKVATGEFPIGVTLDYIVRDMKAKGSPIDIIYPADGAVVIPSPIGIIRTTKQPDGAKKFLDFMLSTNGQKILREVGTFVPVRPTLAPPEGVPSLEQLLKSGLPTDWAYIRRNTKWLRDRFSTIMLD